MGLIDEVRQFIADALPNSETNLEVTPGGRVVGRVLWTGFDGQEHLERQNRIWELLRDRFQSRSTQIGVLLAYTPHEFAVMQSV